MKNFNILGLDDRERLGNTESIEVYLGKIFPGSVVRHFYTVQEAIIELENNNQSEAPSIVFYDASGSLNKTKGYDEFLKLMEWGKANRPEHFPHYAVFMSADFECACQCKRLAIASDILPDGNIFAISKGEIFLARQYVVEGKIFSLGFWRDEDSGEFRRFINHALDLNLPVTTQEMEAALIRDGRLWPEDVIFLYRSEKMSATRALEILSTNENGTFSDGSWDYVETTSVSKASKAGFQKGSGEARHGYAAFTLEDALNIRRQGKDPVLIVQRFDPDWYTHLPQLAGLVVMESEASGHLALLATSYGVASLIAPATTKTMTQCYPLLAFSQSDAPLVRLVQGDHPSLEYIYGSAEQIADNQGDDAFIDIKELWKEPTVIIAGAPVTIDPETSGCGIYDSHVSMGSNNFRRHVGEIRHIYRRAAVEHCKPFMRFKANIDALQQVDKAYALAGDGIGLVRTEHLAFADTTSLQALRDIFTQKGSSGMALDALKQRQQAQTTAIFDTIQKNWSRLSGKEAYPVRMRLLDAPPEEFLSPSDYLALSAIIPVSEQRGVQMGMRMPELYQNQIDAIFAAYAEFSGAPAPSLADEMFEDYKDMYETKEEFLASLGDCLSPETDEDRSARKANIGLEIMVPTVKTLDELLSVKQMVMEAALKHNVSRSEFKFGMMLETTEAAERAEYFAPHVDFVSIGSNDLTSAVTGIARSNIVLWNAVSNPRPGKGDPFTNIRKDVVKLLRGAVRRMRSVNRSISVDLCGAHAADLESLKKMRTLGLNSVSLPPSGRNHIALPADWALHDFRRWNKRPSRKAGQTTERAPAA